MAINPTNPTNLVGACQFEVRAGTRLPGSYASFDAGHTWHDNGVLPVPPGYDGGADTTVGFDGGVGFVVALLSSGGGGYPSRVTKGGIFIWRTTDGGRTFSRPVPVYEGPRFQDHPWLAITASHPGSLFIAWTNEDGLELSVSHDGGTSFGSPQLLVAGAAPSNPVVTLGAGRGIQVFYEQLGAPGRPVSLYVMDSSDSGAQFSPARLVGAAPAPPNVGGGPKGNTNQPPPLLGAAADSATGASAVAISGQDPRLGHPVLSLWQWGGRGSDWVGPLHPVNGPDAGESQIQPRLIYIGHRLVISYFLVSRSGQISERLIEQRPPGGFEDEPLDSSPFQASGFIGDYQAIASDVQHGYLLWNQALAGRLEIVAEQFAMS